MRTDAGTVYADIRDKILPYLRKQEADCLGSLDLQRRTLKELDGFRARLEFARAEAADRSAVPWHFAQSQKKVIRK